MKVLYRYVAREFSWQKSWGWETHILLISSDPFVSSTKLAHFLKPEEPDPYQKFRSLLPIKMEKGDQDLAYKIVIVNKVRPTRRLSTKGLIRKLTNDSYIVTTYFTRLDESQKYSWDILYKIKPETLRELLLASELDTVTEENMELLFEDIMK